MNNIVWSALIAGVLAAVAVVTAFGLVLADELSAESLITAVTGAAIVASVLSLRER